ncbi:hypothetical protein RI820_000981 [Pluralibacter gergoviae]|nr:hypothetical protein [Pluralibacter gergoviae]ELC3016122.1 hypothetical protein [Pluralibacter gergoviae]ELC3021102.1 hypothetical protein [Pluralibacter gergoviae]
MAGFFRKLFGSEKKVVSTDSGELSEAELIIARANNELKLRTQAAVDMWGLDTASWAVDLDTGIITFTSEEKGIVITAPVQVVGTYNTEDGSWLWGWEHPSVSEPLRAFARRVRDFGEQYGKKELTTRKITTSMDTAWEFTALACHLNGGEGGYSGSSGSTRVLLVYGSVSITKKD